MIKKYVNKVEINDQEDIEQEILMKIHKICLKFTIKNDKTKEDNTNQFIKYIHVTIKNIYYDYLRKEKVTLLENDELLKETEEEKKTSFSKLNNNEIEFLNLFIQDGKYISDTKVAKILGISKQAVNKRKHKIYQKLKK